MAYLNVDPDFFQHPKVKRLRKILGMEVEIFVIRLWAHCAKFHPADGLLRDVGAEEIETYVDFTGESGKLVDAMVKVGLLDETQEGFKIHDWQEHEGHIEALRKRARNAAVRRWEKIKRGKNVDTSGIPQASSGHAPSMHELSPVPSIPNHPYCPSLPSEPAEQAEPTDEENGRLSQIAKTIKGSEGLIKRGKDPSELVEKLITVTGYEPASGQRLFKAGTKIIPLVS